MTNFETILDHLGPTAKPLMAFLDVADAKNMLTVSKYTSSIVSAYSKRWGFKMPPYMEYADGIFVITIREKTWKYKPLKPHETLGIGKALRNRFDTQPRYSLDIRGGELSYQTRLIYGTRDEIKGILDCAKPYMINRKLRLSREAEEKAKQKEIDDAAAAKAAYLAKYTIKAIGPPTYPWGKKASA